jgi:hypothetical protein
VVIGKTKRVHFIRSNESLLRGMDPDAENWRGSEITRIVSKMAGASGRSKPIAGVTGPWSEVQRRVRGEIGLRFMGAGRLAEPWGGHPVGAPYLLLRADCSLERRRAHDLLGDIAGVTDLHWAHGWTGRRLSSGDVVAELRIFPGQTPSPVG